MDSFDTLYEIPDGVLPAARTWLMRRWDPATFVQAIQAVVDLHNPAPDWSSVANALDD